MTLQSDWTAKSEKFALDRAKIRQVLSSHQQPMDMAEIYATLKVRFRYLPDIERRMRELVEQGAVEILDGSVRNYRLTP